MDILVVNCNTSTEMSKQIDIAARAVARPGTVITTATPTWGVESAEGFYDSFISAAAVLELLTTWTEPVDAVVLAGFGEHGREGARQLLDVPVVDITEASVLTALLIGQRYGIVTTTHTAVEQIRGSLIGAGVADRCAGVRPTGIRVLDIDVDPAATLAIMLEHGRELLAAGADVIVLGCAGMASLRAELEKTLGAPVVDGVESAVALCEAIVGIGLQTSKSGAYATPDLGKRRPGWATGTPLAGRG